ncbi:MAG: winged helix-turn-helix transcriptional regulator, partial [Thermoleophilaceae bacterium]|nr:winged helix-turn-helix transcriptional regulator [Thermoleophilaceae bacterium]
MATAATPLPDNGAAPLPGAVFAPLLLELDRAAREVFVTGREVHLTRLEFSLLDALAERPSAIVTKERLLRDVWGYRTLGRTRTIDAHACRLRQKLSDERLVHNVRGVGYRLVKHQDSALVLVGERPAPRADSDEARPARPLALVRGIDPAVEIAAVVLAIPRS